MNDLLNVSTWDELSRALDDRQAEMRAAGECGREGIDGNYEMVKIHFKAVGYLEWGPS